MKTGEDADKKDKDQHSQADVVEDESPPNDNKKATVADQQWFRIKYIN